MNRRRLLRGVGAVTVAGVAGCLGGNSGGGGSFSTFSGTPQSVGGVELPVPESELSRGARKDAIPAITEPAFGSDWSGVEATLDDERVIGVEHDGRARAYPLANPHRRRCRWTVRGDDARAGKRPVADVLVRLGRFPPRHGPL